MEVATRFSGRRRMLGALAVLPWVLSGCDTRPSEATLSAGMSWPSDLAWGYLTGRDATPFPTGNNRLVNFWASWCPPCRAEMAGLDRLHARWRRDGFSVVGISVDEDVYLVREYLLHYPVQFPIFHDPGGTIAQRRLRIQVFPTSVAISASGLVREVYIGERDWSDPRVQGELEARLGA